MDFEELLKQKAVICLVDEPSAIAYTSLYEEGDVWIKIRGCEDCPSENIAKCCGTCPMVTEAGCYFHLLRPKNSMKPYSCVAHPYPTFARSWCMLEFRCVRGDNLGKIRCVRDKNGVLRDGHSGN